MSDIVGGTKGALAGWLAMVTPAFLIIPLIVFAGSRAQHPRVRRMIQMVVLASAGLLWAAALPLAQGAIKPQLDALLLMVCLAVLLARRMETLWVVIGAGTISLLVSSLPLFQKP